MYLRRRIEGLLADLNEGRLRLMESSEFATELRKVVLRDDGSVDLKSCSPELRSKVRAYAAAKLAMDEPQPEREPPTAPTVEETVRLNRELLTRFETFFRAATGMAPEKFPRDEGFGAAMHAVLKRVEASAAIQDLEDALNELRVYLNQSNMNRFYGAKALVGNKLVLGGAPHFSVDSLSAIRSMLLYSDTVLIADPVHPFFEGSSGFSLPRLPKMLEQIILLSRLRPLVDADLPYPAIAIFPSFEKSFMEKDSHTQDGIEMLILSLFSHFGQESFDDIEELTDYAKRSPAELTTTIQSNRLLFAPGGAGSDSFSSTITGIRSEIAAVKHPRMVEHLNKMTDASLALFYIENSLVPHFHLSENVDSLAASPLMARAEHWHYFQLLRQVEQERMIDQGMMAPDTGRVIEALASPSVAWLGNVPITELVRLRQDLANEEFRKLLNNYIEELGDVDETNLDNVTQRVVRALTRLVAEHEKEARKIVDEYQRHHAVTAVGTWITVGAMFTPLFPVAAASGLGAAIKYGGQKASEKLTLAANRKTLFGVLAAAQKKQNKH